MKNKLIGILFFISLGLNFQCTKNNTEPTPIDNSPQVESVQVNTEIGTTFYSNQPPVFASDHIEITDTLTTVTIQKVAQTTDNHITLIFTSEQPPSDWTFPLLFDANPDTESSNNLRKS